jgi:hypothetical protein
MDNNTTEPSSLYFFNNSEDIKKAEKKLNNAKAAYANIGANEEVLFLFDDTVFGGAKEGFIVTSSSIYSHTINKDGISFVDIDKIYLTNPIDRKIMIRGKDGSDTFIHLSTQMDKEIPPYFNILSKYLSMLNMINSLGNHDIAEDIVIENAFKVIENSADGATNEELIKAFKSSFNTSNSQESKPLNSKTAYSEKIASGEIDPTEVSFAEFDKNFIKENIKKIYSEKIASGELDPTEVSFADFADSMQTEDAPKLNSEQISSASTRSIEEIIEVIKKEYKGHEDLDEMVTDLSGNAYLDHWARRLVRDEFNNNSNLARELFQLQLKECESSSDLSSLASDVASSLDDKDWATKILKEAYSKIDGLSDYNLLIEKIMNSLEDSKWACSLSDEAIEKLRNAKKSDEVFEFSGSPSEILTLAQFIASEDGTNDKEKAKEIFDLIKDYEGVTDLLDAGRSVIEIYGDDYSDQYANEALEVAIRNVDSGYYCDIYTYIKDDLDDESRADEWKDDHYDEMENEYNENGSCEEIFKTNLEVSTDASGYFKLEIINTGGEYAYGFVTDESQKALIKEKIDNSEIALDNDGDGVEASFFMYENVLHVYGPNGSDANLSLTVYEDEDCDNEIEEVFSQESIDSLGVNIFTSSNPYPDNFKNNIESDALIFGGYYVEKRIHYPAVIKIEEGEQFEITNVYIGLMNLDETLCEDQIVNKVLYIRPDVAQEIMNNYNNGDNSDDPLSDYIGEMYSDFDDMDQVIQDLLKKSECTILDIQGKGEREDQFVVVKTMDGEVLFEGEC